MFRKEEALARDWTPEKSAELSDIQKDLILKAADMLRPGGMMLYSTCTFSPCEDEEVVAHLLQERPDMELMEMPGYEGFSEGRPELISTPISPEAFDPSSLRKCIRIFPHKMDGEGHFLALFHKKAPPFLQFSALPEKVLTKAPGNGWRNFLQKSVFILLEDRNLTGTAWKSARTRFTISFHSHWISGVSLFSETVSIWADLKKKPFRAITAPGTWHFTKKILRLRSPCLFLMSASPAISKVRPLTSNQKKQPTKRLASSLHRRLSDRFRQTCKRNPEKQNILRAGEYKCSAAGYLLISI